MVAYHVSFRGLPLEFDLRCFITYGKEITWHPLIRGLRMMTLSTHWFCMKLAMEFLLWIHMIVPILDDTQWYSNFRDYIFPRALMPYVQPNLVVISMAGVPCGDHGPKWLEGEDTSNDSEDQEF